MPITLDKVDINPEKNKISVNINFDGNIVRYHLKDGKEIVDLIFKEAQEEYKSMLNKQMLMVQNALESKKNDKSNK